MYIKNFEEGDIRYIRLPPGSEKIAGGAII